MKKQDLLNFNKKIEECRSRAIALEDLRKLLKSYGAEEPRQWRSIASNILKLDSKKFSELDIAVSKLLEKHRTFNDKIITLYADIDESQLIELNEQFKNICKDSGQDVGYGYVTDSTIQLSENDSIYVHRFIKKREVYNKEEIDLNDLTKDTQTEFSEFDKVIGVRAIEITCFDSIFLDLEKKSLAVQLDLASQLRASDVDKSIEVFFKMLNQIIVESIGKRSKLDKSDGINFYPCIKKFYENPEAYVTKLSFTTSKGVHHETLKGAATDIRKADYHIGGKAKENGVIYPYRINKKFKIKDKAPEVFVGVRYQYYAKPGSKFLGVAHLNNVLDLESYTYVINKLIENT